MSLLMPRFFLAGCVNTLTRLIQLNRCRFHSCLSHEHERTRAHTHTQILQVLCTCSLHLTLTSFSAKTLAFDQKHNDMQIKWCVLVCVCVCVRQSVLVPQWTGVPLNQKYSSISSTSNGNLYN